MNNTHFRIKSIENKTKAGAVAWQLPQAGL